MPDIEEFLQPISDTSPAGDDIRYDVVYDEIRNARESDPPDLPRRPEDPAPRVADHREVKKLAEGVLKKQCKHLQVAAWLTEAWTHLDGFPGLQSGLDLERELLTRFWDTVFPEIDEGDLEYRVAPLEWIAGYLGPSLQSIPINTAGHHVVDFKVSRAVGYEEDMEDTEARQNRAAAIESGKLAPEDFDKAVAATPKAWYKNFMLQADAVLASVDALEKVSDEKFGNLAPSYRPLRESVAELQRVVRPILDRKLEEDPDPVEAVAAEESPAGELAVASAEGGGVPLEPVSKDDAGARVAAAARFLRRADPFDPAPYLMIRGLRWGELRKGAGAVEPRLLAAPPTRTRTQLKSLLLDGKWEALLEASEEVMATPFGRGWLDLQRYVFTALDGLGSQYDAVEKSLKAALRSLLVELPDLADLTLMDDTPTANRETQAWLREEGLLGPLTEEEQARFEGGQAAAAVSARDVSERARERIRAGQPQKAIELLMQAADRENGTRGRTLRRAEAAGVMVDHGLSQVAMPILRDIMQRIEAHQLEEWEDAETVAVPMALLYRCIGKLGGDPSEQEALYLRVCRLDPMKAILFNQDDEGAAGDGNGIEDA